MLCGLLHDTGEMHVDPLLRTEQLPAADAAAWEELCEWLVTG